jgi:hypothetical protein
MRRIPGLAVAVAEMMVLSGCSLLTPLPGFPQSGPGAAELEVGSCLDGMSGADSDRRSVVDCDQPHLFEVTAVTEWPGMADAIEEAGGAAEAWDALHVIVGSTGEPTHPEYFDWAETACETATQQVLRIDDVELDGKSAADIWLRLGAGYGVDLSLDTREGFVAGDHRTVCSAAWYDARGNPLSVTLGDGITLSDAAGPDFPLDQRECWDDEFYLTTCKVPHAAQVLVGFDGVATLGAELVAKLGNGDGTDSDWEVADTVCDQLLDQTLPSSADFGPDLGYLSEIGISPGWEAFEGTLDPDQNYPFACVALGDEGTMFEGDVFDGTAAVVEN